MVKAYQKVDLLILDEWLIRCLTPEESYNLFEIIEARTKHGSTIFCTQFETEGWYKRVNPDPENDSPISEASWTGLFITLTRYSLTVIPR